MATNQLISTMATPLLVYNYTMVFEAIDPATGSVVSGVKITNPVVSGINLSAAPEESSPQEEVAPLWLPEPVQSDGG